MLRFEGRESEANEGEQTEGRVSNVLRDVVEKGGYTRRSGIHDVDEREIRTQRSGTLRNPLIQKRKERWVYLKEIRDEKGHQKVPARNSKKNSIIRRIAIPVLTTRVNTVPPRSERVISTEASFTEGIDMLFEPVNLGIPGLLGASVVACVKKVQIPVRIMNLQ